MDAYTSGSWAAAAAEPRFGVAVERVSAERIVVTFAIGTALGQNLGVPYAGWFQAAVWHSRSNARVMFSDVAAHFDVGIQLRSQDRLDVLSA
jgi:hypothetical protein